MKNTLDAWELSLNLGATLKIERYIGTHYHANDTYRDIIKREVAITRIHPATDNGSMTGTPVFLSDEDFKLKLRQGSYNFCCQQLLDTVVDKTQSFKEEHLRYYKRHNNGKGMNIYIPVDSANEKKDESDYTAI